MLAASLASVSGGAKGRRVVPGNEVCALARKWDALQRCEQGEVRAQCPISQAVQSGRNPLGGGTKAVEFGAASLQRSICCRLHMLVNGKEWALCDIQRRYVCRVERKHASTTAQLSEFLSREHCKHAAFIVSYAMAARIAFKRRETYE